MQIVIVGTGYVGLVTGTCLAETGNDITCVDCDRKKIDLLNRGHLPIYEPGLSELVTRNVTGGRLRFTADLASAAKTAKIVFLAVGTPPSEDGSANLSSLWAVIDQIAPLIPHDCIVICKSTVPVGTNAKVAARLKELTGRDVDVASNPEFLKEGMAIDDFMKPDRVVVGVRRKEIGEVLRDLYEPYLRTDKPFLIMSPESAEMTKYAANSLLSTKISFINEIANLCERAGANINDVRRGIGHDSRLGFAFLFPGVGYGGSCFPKDVRALAALARSYDMEPKILDAVHNVNEHQKTVLIQKIEKHFDGKLAGKAVAIWGLAFKPSTDDVREAPSLVLIDRLLDMKATVRVHDPEAMDNVRAIYGDRLVYCQKRDDTLRGADALAICTEWKQFVRPDFAEMKRQMRQPVIFDGRNIYDLQQLKGTGFTYYSIGRPTVTAQGTA
jgi:UDPglucose 6-dehydrogenase